jgi:hypothetical protein
MDHFVMEAVVDRKLANIHFWRKVHLLSQQESEGESSDQQYDSSLFWCSVVGRIAQVK